MNRMYRIDLRRIPYLQRQEILGLKLKLLKLIAWKAGLNVTVSEGENRVLAFKTSISNLQVAVSKVETSVRKTNLLIAEVQSRLKNVCDETSEQVNSWDSRVSRMDKVIKGYINGRMNELWRVTDNSNSVIDQEPVNIVECVRKDVRLLQEKNKKDELILEGLRDLVVDVKEQLSKTIDIIQSTITTCETDNQGNRGKKCELIKGM